LWYIYFMKTNGLYITRWIGKILVSCYFLCIVIPGYSQMPPPGYDRAVKIQEEKKKLSPLDRDSIMIIDTVVIFDPTTYEESTTITNTKYSLKYYCKEFLLMQDPDILLDGNPHTIVDPKTYEDLIIRLNQSGKIDTIAPKK